MCQGLLLSEHTVLNIPASLVRAVQYIWLPILSVHSVTGDGGFWGIQQVKPGETQRDGSLVDETYSLSSGDWSPGSRHSPAPSKANPPLDSALTGIAGIPSLLIPTVSSAHFSTIFVSFLSSLLLFL